MENIPESAMKQLDERAKSLKWEVEKVLDDKVESLKEQLHLMTEIKLPTDILQLYMENDGRLWVSKRVQIIERGRFDLSVSSRSIFYPREDSREPDFRLPTGVYRLILIAVPAEMEEGAQFDDYRLPLE